MADIHAGWTIHYWREWPCKGFRDGGRLQCSRYFRFGGNWFPAGAIAAGGRAVPLREESEPRPVHRRPLGLGERLQTSSVCLRDLLRRLTANPWLPPYLPTPRSSLWAEALPA